MLNLNHNWQSGLSQLSALLNDFKITLIECKLAFI